LNIFINFKVLKLKPNGKHLTSKL